MNYKPEFENIEIIKCKNGVFTVMPDAVVNEVNITIKLQCGFLGALTCTPTNIQELAVGYLITSGLVSERNRIINIDYNEGKHIVDISLENNKIPELKDVVRMQAPGCGGKAFFYIFSPTVESWTQTLKITPEQVSGLMNSFNKTSKLFKETGGVHSAAIADKSNVIVFMEDIGRHNAVDKVIGFMHLNKNSLEDKILLSSGRVSSEIIVKAANAGFQIVISRGAPTLKGVELAKKSGLTLLGFARANVFNIYSHHERIINSKESNNLN